MSEKLPETTPEKAMLLDDNARKFIVDAIDPEFLEMNNASSFTLSVDWLETGEDNEKKLAYKQFDNGNVQILLISKITTDGKRTSDKKAITEEEYKELRNQSTLHLEKTRHEFELIQNDTSFSLKYDVFADGDLYLLEVDAEDEETRDSFDPNDFSTTLTEVTGDIKYYGYRVAALV